MKIYISGKITGTTDYMERFKTAEDKLKSKEYKRSEQVKRCGNAVPPPFAKALVAANLPELCGMAAEQIA